MRQFNKLKTKLGKFLKNRILFDELREDARKFAVTAIGAGFIGLILKLDKVTQLEAILILSFGLLVWVLSLIKWRKDKKKNED